MTPEEFRQIKARAVEFAIQEVEQLRAEIISLGYESALALEGDTADKPATVKAAVEIVRAECIKGRKAWREKERLKAELEQLREARGCAWESSYIRGAKIVCLCGSTRFTDEMLIKQWELAKSGVVSLGWNALPGSYFADGRDAHLAELEDCKELVDELHKRKIDLADEVFVLNIGGYIGYSTRSEIEYAELTGKPVVYQEPEEDS